MPLDTPTPSTTSAAPPAAPAPAPIADTVIGTPAAAPVTEPTAVAAPVTGDTPPPAADTSITSWSERATKYAKGDEKLQKQLGRYASEEAVIDALLAAQKKISSGALKTALPENPNEEQLNAWREENGVPLTVDDYEVSLPEDLDLPPEMEGMIDAFAKEAHEANYTPAQLEKGLNFLVKSRQEAAAAQTERDLAARVDAEEALRSEWGTDYRLNINLINSLLDGAPQGVKDQLLGARLPNGLTFGNNPEIARWLSNLAREVNPVASVVPPGGNIDGVNTELNMIQGLMGDKESKYWKGPEAQSLQARFLSLLDAKNKHAARS